MWHAYAQSFLQMLTVRSNVTGITDDGCKREREKKEVIWLYMLRVLCFLTKSAPLKVMFYVCVRYKSMFAYCVPTLRVLHTVYPPP